MQICKRPHCLTALLLVPVITLPAFTVSLDYVRNSILIIDDHFSFLRSQNRLHPDCAAFLNML